VSPSAVVKQNDPLESQNNVTSGTVLTAGIVSTPEAIFEGLEVDEWAGRLKILPKIPRG